jgi:hypothetical protein
MPAISLTAYSRFLDQLVQQIKTEPKIEIRTRLFADCKALCMESRKLNFYEEMTDRGIRLGTEE